jgi:hypothetical protein
MKKFTAFLIAGLLTCSFVFGDDAVVLPQGVFRLRAIPSYSMLDQAYDKDGKSVDSVKGAVTVFSSALELGLTPAVTLGAQWAPGVVLANTFDRVPGSTTPGKVSIAGLKDLQVGAKLELVGA